MSNDATRKVQYSSRQVILDKEPFFHDSRMILEFMKPYYGYSLKPFLPPSLFISLFINNNYVAVNISK